MGIIEYIDKLIAERGSATVLRERLALLKEQAQPVLDEAAQLREENATLKQRVAQLEAELSAKARRDEFVEHRGALFKLNPRGGYHQAVFCPKCLGPMSSTDHLVDYSCESCRLSVDFTGRQLSAVLSELSRA